MIGPAAATFERVAAEYEYGRPSWPAEAVCRHRRRRGRGFVPVVEDEQLRRAVPLARDVREDALAHVLTLSDALYARFAAW